MAPFPPLTGPRAALAPLAFSRSPNHDYTGRTTSLLGGIGVFGTQLLTKSETGGTHELTLVTLKPGSVWTTPASADENAVYYVVEGYPTISLGEQSALSPLGAFVPAGVRCVLQNNRGCAARLLRLTLPTTSRSTDTPYLIHAETGDPFGLGTHRSRAIVDSRRAQGSLLWLDTHADCGAFIPPHIHHHEDETFYVLAGRFRIEAADAIIDAEPGHVVFGPRHVAHSWQCVSSEGGRLQTLITPGENFETFARTMAEQRIVPAREMADPVRAAAFLALTAKHGMQMLPPAHHIK